MFVQSVSAFVLLSYQWEWSGTGDPWILKSVHEKMIRRLVKNVLNKKGKPWFEARLPEQLPFSRLSLSLRFPLHETQVIWLLHNPVDPFYHQVVKHPLLGNYLIHIVTVRVIEGLGFINYHS